jgi:membrane-associated phospholipid phosphatase
VLGAECALWGQFVWTVLVQVVSIFIAAQLFERDLVRLAAGLEVFLVTGTSALVIIFLAVVLAMSAQPLQDSLLIDIDSALGFSWLGAVQWFHERPWASYIACQAYGTLVWQIPCILIALALFRPDYLRRFASSWCLCSLMTVLIFPFLPAVGGYLHYGLSRYDFPNITTGIPWEQAVVLVSAQKGTLKVVDRSVLIGFIEFPSFHASAAVLCAYAWWQVPVVRYPALALNVVMLISAVPCGGHYLIDILVGAGLAAASVWAVRRYFARTVPLPIDTCVEIWRRVQSQAGQPTRASLLARQGQIALSVIYEVVFGRPRQVASASPRTVYMLAGPQITR